MSKKIAIKVRCNCTLTGKPAEVLLQLKQKGLVSSVRDAVVQGLMALNDIIIARELNEARLKTIERTENSKKLEVDPNRLKCLDFSKQERISV